VYPSNIILTHLPPHPLFLDFMRGQAKGFNTLLEMADRVSHFKQGVKSIDPQQINSVLYRYYDPGFNEAMSMRRCYRRKQSFIV